MRQVIAAVLLLASCATAQETSAQANGPAGLPAGPFFFSGGTMTTTACIECGGDVAIAVAPMVGEIAPCRDCGVELEVLGIAPLELALAPEIEEDWGE